MNYESILNSLACCFSSGEQNLDSIVESCAQALGHRWRWLRPLAGNYLKAAQERARPDPLEVVEWIHASAVFRSA